MKAPGALNAILRGSPWDFSWGGSVRVTFIQSRAGKMDLRQGPLASGTFLNRGSGHLTPEEGSPRAKWTSVGFKNLPKPGIRPADKEAAGVGGVKC